MSFAPGSSPLRRTPGLLRGLKQRDEKLEIRAKLGAGGEADGWGRRLRRRGMNLFIPSSRRRCLPDFKHVSTFSLIDLVNPVNPVQQIFALLAALREVF